jgi:hypothetical protein
MRKLLSKLFLKKEANHSPYPAQIFSMLLEFKKEISLINTTEIIEKYSKN